MPTPKNVLVLMGDHHRHDAMSWKGHPQIRTPNLDQLAERSVRFSRCYNQAPVCSPARHSLATGRYAHAHGVIDNGSQPFAGMSTIAHALQPHGYRRINVGHMHWFDKDQPHGYEPWISHEGFLDGHSDRIKQIEEWEHQTLTRRRTGGPSPRNRTQYSGYQVATNAIAQIESAVEEGKPFLCWTAFSEPHPPFYPPRELYERIDQAAIELPEQAPADAPPPHESILKKREEWAHLTEVEIRQIIAGYYGMVELMDGYAGMVLDAIDRLGLRDDTLIIWTSDHGDQMWEGELFLKFMMRDSAVHVPLMVSGPGIEGADRDEFVEHVDVFPTICEALRIDVPDSVQGCSLKPLLARDTTAPGDWRNAVFSQISGQQMIRTDEWKLVVYEGEPGELFDMKNDSNEHFNLIGDESKTDLIAELFDRLKVWEAANAGG